MVLTSSLYVSCVFVWKRKRGLSSPLRLELRFKLKARIRFRIEIRGALVGVPLLFRKSTMSAVSKWGRRWERKTQAKLACVHFAAVATASLCRSINYVSFVPSERGGLGSCPLLADRLYFDAIRAVCVGSNCPPRFCDEPQ